MEEQTMKKVGFFIIGAPKCGTTSLAEYLKSHPDIILSKKKEPNFFSKDLIKFQRLNDIKTFEHYLNLFCFEEKKMLGEASTTYLFSKEAVQHILEYNPAAKMIVILRNPVDMIVAWHTQKLKEKQENEIDFKTAWTKQRERKEGREIPELCTDEKMLFYKEWGLLGEQIQRLFKQVPRSQCHIIFFDDIVADTEKVYRAVLDFLGLKYDGRSEFRAYNQYMECRNHKLDEFRVRLNRIRKKNDLINKMHRSLISLLPAKGLGIQKLLFSINYKKSKRKYLDEDFRKELVAEFHEDICLLEKLTGRYLANWKS